MEKSRVDLRENLSLLKKHLISIYVLNISDLVITLFLLNSNTNLFMEGNIFLRPIVDNWKIYFVKIVLFALILVYWYVRSNKSNERQLRNSMILSNVLIIFYGIINCLHIFNLIILGVVSF